MDAKGNATMSYAEVLGKWLSAEHELCGRSDNDDMIAEKLNRLGGELAIALAENEQLEFSLGGMTCDRDKHEEEADKRYAENKALKVENASMKKKIETAQVKAKAVVAEPEEIEEVVVANPIPDKMPYSLKEIMTCKNIDPLKVWIDYQSLVKFDAETNPRKFCGNKTIYQYQFQELLKCRRDSKGYKTIDEWFADPELKEKLWKDTIHRNRRDKAPYPNPTDVYECHRINNGAIVPFKASTAKYIYKKFGATSVLDPTMGWGGRMLGATSLNINYIGFDTNTDLRPGYEGMIHDLFVSRGFLGNDIKLFWETSLNEDIIKTLDYDMVLTSPPYENMELYSHMTPWTSDDQFYKEFLIPLIDLCHKYLKDGGKSCWNISPKMYKKLTKKYHYRECDSQEDLRQQLGKQYKTKSQDYIYIWTK